MISKERLQELIERGATIYYNNTVSVQDKTLDKTYQVDNGYLWRKIKNGAIKSCGYPLENLFETEEDARWELEMTATRTETLKLPTWEEIYETANKEFYNLRDNMYFEIIGRRYPSYDERTIRLVKAYTKILFEKPLTKENYIEACKLAKKLFLGE